MATPILWWAFQELVVVCALIVIVMAIGLALRNRPAWRHSLWVLVLIKLLAPPIVSWPITAQEMSVWVLPERAEVSEVPVDSSRSAASNLSGRFADTRLNEPVDMNEADPFPASAIPSEGIAGEELLTETPAAVLGDSNSLSANIASQASEPVANPPATDVGERIRSIAARLAESNAPFVLLVVWFAGGCVMFIVQMRRLAQLQAIIASASPSPAELSKELQLAAQTLGMPAPPEAVISEKAGPFLCCLGRVRLVWPQHLVSKQALKQSRGILIHELAHIQRRDHWVAWLELAGSVIWWWNPLFLLVRSQLRECSEMTCDAIAIQVHQDRREYAQAFMQLSTQRSPAAAPSLGVMSGSRTCFERRLKMILSDDVSSRFSPWCLLLVGCLAIACLPAWPFGHPSATAESFSAASTTPDAGQDSSSREPEAELTTGFATTPAGNLARGTLRFGPPAENGLRVAVRLVPDKHIYTVGDKIDCQIVFLNDGNKPIQWVAAMWRQMDQWNIQYANGEEIPATKFEYDGVTELKRLRLQPGETVSVDAADLLLSKQSSKNVPATVGREVFAEHDNNVSLSVNVRVPKHQAVASAPQDWSGELQTGLVKFHVVAPPRGAQVRIPAMPPTFIWGESQNDLQLGIGWKDAKLHYQDGDALELELKVRNTSGKSKQVRAPKFRSAHVTVQQGAELWVTLQGNDQELLTLAPHEERDIPLDGERIRSNGLPRDFYRVLVFARMALPDPRAHNFGFYLDSARRQRPSAVPRKSATHSDPRFANVAWGEPLLGLSLGMRWLSKSQSFSSGEWEFLLWNASGQSSLWPSEESIEVEYSPRKSPKDWDLYFRNRRGHELICGQHKRKGAKIRQTLAPNQVVSLGKTTWAAIDSGVEPGPDGQHGLFTVLNLRRLDYPHFLLQLANRQLAAQVGSPVTKTPAANQTLPEEAAAAEGKPNGNKPNGDKPTDDKTTDGEGAGDQSAEGPFVMGLDLSQASWKRAPRDLPDLYEPTPDNPGRWRGRASVFPMPLREDGVSRRKSIWLKYPVTLGRFYIQYRSDSKKPETEKTYGPFEGDPFERLGLDDLLEEKLQGSTYVRDELYRIGLMLRTDDRQMVKRAARLLGVYLTGTRPIDRKSRQLRFVSETVDRFQEAFERHGMASEIQLLRRQIRDVEKAIDEATISVPDDKYRLGEPTKPEQVIPAEAWGLTQRGLRLALLVDPREAQFGEAVNCLLVLQNVSEQPIKFSASDLLQSARADVLDSNNEKVSTKRSFASGAVPILRYRLNPGERMVLAKPSLQFLQDGEKGDFKMGRTRVIVKDTQVAKQAFKVHFSLNLSQGNSWTRSADGELQRIVPARGEWSGELTTGQVTVTASK